MKTSKSQVGLSLIELMVSVALGLLLILAIVQVMFTSKSSFILERESALLQENARFALEFLRADAVKAGFTGCSPSAAFTNVVADPSNPDEWHLNTPGIQGFDHAEQDSFPDTIDSVGDDERWPDTDAFASVFLKFEYDDAPGAANKAILDVLQTAGVQPPGVVLGELAPGDGIAIVDEGCSKINMQSLSDPATILLDLAYGYSVITGACPAAGAVDDVLNAASCPLINPAAMVATGALEGVKVANAVQVIYFVAPSNEDETVPALYRMGRDGNREELVQGVENLQIRYGYDADSPADGVPNYYLEAGNTDFFSPWDWDRVVSMRFAILMRSINPVDEAEPAEDFEGVTIPADKYLRQRLVSVLQLKNRAYY